MTKFQLAVKCLVNFDNKFLVLQRSASAPTNPLIWDLPGGLVDDSELPDASIIREINEESSLGIKNLKLISNTIFERKGEPTLVLFYSAEALSDKVIISNEHCEYKWVNVQDLKELEIQSWIKSHLKDHIFDLE